jgi:hypothetical protein
MAFLCVLFLIALIARWYRYTFWECRLGVSLKLLRNLLLKFHVSTGLSPGS